MLTVNNIQITCSCYNYIYIINNIFNFAHFKTFHCCLKSTNRIYFRNKNLSPESDQWLRTPFTDITITAYKNFFSCKHYICSSLDPVNEWFTASVEIVKLGFSNRVIYINGREKQLTLFFKLIKPVNSGGCFFRNPFDRRWKFAPVFRILFQPFFYPVHKDPFFFNIIIFWHHFRIILSFYTFMDQDSCISSIINNKVGSWSVRPCKSLLKSPPVFFKIFTLPCKYCRLSICCNSCCCMILCRKNIAWRPSDIRTKLKQCIYQHCGLNCHM